MGKLTSGEERKFFEHERRQRIHDLLVALRVAAERMKLNNEYWMEYFDEETQRWEKIKS